MEAIESATATTTLSNCRAVKILICDTKKKHATNQHQIFSIIFYIFNLYLFMMIDNNDDKLP